MPRTKRKYISIVNEEKKTKSFCAWYQKIIINCLIHEAQSTRKVSGYTQNVVSSQKILKNTSSLISISIECNHRQ